MLVARRLLLGVLLTGLVLSLSGLAGAAPALLSDVPAYNWYHGCGPTAAASVLGYWDLHGYVSLFDASGSDVFLTTNVQDQISSPEHNAKYDPTPDDPGLPDPSDTSIADWFRTSEDPLDYGWSYLSYSDDAFSRYANYRGYTLNSWYEPYGDDWFAWSDLTGEIDAGRPLMFLVDSDGNGGTDHFVPVFGYEDRIGAGQWYACYTTWSEFETVEWYQFRGMSASYDWGVGYATYAQPSAPPPAVPELGTPALLALSAATMGGILRRRRRV